MTKVASRMTTPKPVLSAELTARRGSEDRLVKINTKIRTDTIRQRDCQISRETLLLLVEGFEFIVMNYKVIPVNAGWARAWDLSLRCPRWWF